MSTNGTRLYYPSVGVIEPPDLPTHYTMGEENQEFLRSDTKGPEEMGSITKIPRIWLKRFDRLGPIASKLEDAAPATTVVHTPHIESRAG